MTDTAAGTFTPLIEELRWASATAVAARVRSGDLDPRDVAAAALARIDAAEPVLNAFIRIRHEAALAEADAVAARVAAGEYLPLAGVPVALKDDMATAGDVVTHGSKAITHAEPADHEVVTLLRAAGAVIVGATRTPEFCLFPFTETELGGATRNPWDPTRTPGGSSGGSAAAVAAGLVPLAIGGDGGGSIRGPGAWCGLPGLFPTPGSITEGDLPPGWGGLAVRGGFGRSIADVALLYDVLLSEPQHLAAAITEELGPLRIGLSFDRMADKPVPQGGRIAPQWTRAADLTATLLSQIGHDVEPVRVKFGTAGPKFSVRYLTELGKELAETDQPSAASKQVRTLAKLGRPLRRFVGWANDTSAEQAAVAASLKGFDVLLTPAMPVPPPKIGENDGRSGIAIALKSAQRVSFLNVWNLLGWCGISVPAGLDADGLPVAILLTARPGQERLLLQLAAQLERERPWELGKAVA
ncbi:MAG: amidase family protein [Solirubrobacteraceae bacterium]